MTGHAVPVIGPRAQGAGLRAVAIDAPTLRESSSGGCEG